MRNYFVIFGGTGDISRRKLYPALFDMHRRNRLPARVIACSRAEIPDGEFKEKAAEFLQKHRNSPQMASFLRKLEHLRIDPDDRDSFSALRQKVGDAGVVICDLAVPEEGFVPIIRRLEHAFPASFRKGRMRLLVEKPFGHDLASARSLNRLMQRVVGERNIYRIDHFLAKEVVENLLILRFANELFRAVWNNRHVDNVQISFSESLGMEGRGAFYEKTGALRDFVQSHIMQVLGLIAMEEPACLEDEMVKDNKAKALRSLKPLQLQDVVFGQYTAGKVNGAEVPGYAREPFVAKGSKTETFVALRAFVNAPKWRGVPFYIRTGKRMGHDTGVITLVFKKSSMCNFEDVKIPDADALQLVVSPEELFLMRINLKTPEYRMKIKSFSMEYCYSCEHVNDRRKPYEKIYEDALAGDKTRFSRADEVEYAWKWLETLKARPQLHKYPAGSHGPEAADRLLRAQGRRWIETAGDAKADFLYSGAQQQRA
ncbi:Glucose-6-phosphate 1-dehydrogenase [uncultured archaeon]|nr:Glucose-6-phosphate 1-dehydrogenase [uncultured archaeon]